MGNDYYHRINIKRSVTRLVVLIIFVLNSIPSSYKFVKIIKTSGRLIKLDLKAGSAIEDDKKNPKIYAIR